MKWQSQWQEVIGESVDCSSQNATADSQQWLVGEYQVQLVKEFDDICYQKRVKMLAPLIEVSLNNSYWGRWDPNVKKIEISLSLIQDYSWTIVLQVLKHEMAHQYVMEKFADVASNETSHGPLFKTACEILGVKLAFQKATGDLPSNLNLDDESGVDKEAQKILAKIEKLLSLAQSKNEHESFLAMQKVHELNRKYNLEEQKNKKKTEYRIKIISLNKKRIPSYMSQIVSILCRHYFVRVISSWQYNAKCRTTYKAFEVLGSQPNIEMAEYVFFFLEQQSEYLWTCYKQKTGVSGRLKASFLLGVLSGFDEKLLQMKSHSFSADIVATKVNEKSLLAIGDAALDNFVRETFPRLSHRRVGNNRVHGEIYESGRQDGRRLNLHKGMNESRKGTYFLT